MTTTNICFFTVIVALTHDMTIIPFKKCLQPCGNVSVPPNILPHNGLFFSSDRAGIIRTALANMDREAREHYTVVIQAKDMAGQVGGLSGSTTINITLTDINDNPPKFPQSMYTTLQSS